MRESILFADEPGLLADHDTEFHLPIGLLRAPWNHNIVVWPADGGGSLHENYRFGGDCHA